MSTDSNNPTDAIERLEQELDNLRSENKQLRTRVNELEDWKQSVGEDDVGDPSDSVAGDYPELNRNQVQIVQELRDQGMKGETFSQSRYKAIVRRYGDVSQKTTIKNYMKTLVRYGAFKERPGMNFQFIDEREGTHD